MNKEIIISQRTYQEYLHRLMVAIEVLAPGNTHSVISDLYDELIKTGSQHIQLKDDEN